MAEAAQPGAGARPVAPGDGARARRRRWAWVLGLAAALLAAPAPAGALSCPNRGVPGLPYQGFGAETTGGAGEPTVRVTTRADTGPGSLREALSAGHRCIVFNVAGDIVLRSQIYVRGGRLTVDGFTAPAPGITVRDYGIGVWGNHGAHDVILRGLRFRSAGRQSCAAGRCYDGIQVKNGAFRVVIDHVSSDDAGDGAIDIGSQPGTLTRDITIQWSILSGTRNQSLVGRATRVSMHHNLFVNGRNRNPQAQWDPSLATQPPDTVLDFRNNLVWGFSRYGTLIRRRATANVVGNYYYSVERPSGRHALVVDRQGRAHASGNRSGTGADVDGSGTETAHFAAPPLATTDACRAAYQVLAGAGARGAGFGLDAVDRGYIAQIPASRLTGCAGDETGRADTVAADRVERSPAGDGPAPAGPR